MELQKYTLFYLQNSVIHFIIQVLLLIIHIKKSISCEVISVMHNKSLSVSNMEVMEVSLVKSGFSQKLTLSRLLCLYCEDAEVCHICLSVFRYMVGVSTNCLN